MQFKIYIIILLILQAGGDTKRQPHHTKKVTNPTEKVTRTVKTLNASHLFPEALSRYLSSSFCHHIHKAISSRAHMHMCHQSERTFPCSMSSLECATLSSILHYNNNEWRQTRCNAFGENIQAGTPKQKFTFRVARLAPLSRIVSAQIFWRNERARA